MRGIKGWELPVIWGLELWLIGRLRDTWGMAEDSWTDAPSWTEAARDDSISGSTPRPWLLLAVVVVTFLVAAWSTERWWVGIEKQRRH